MYMLDMDGYVQFIYFCPIEGMFVYISETVVIQIPMKVKHYQNIMIINKQRS